MGVNTKVILAYGTTVPARLVSADLNFEESEEIPYDVARDCYTNQGQAFVYLKKTYLEVYCGRAPGGYGTHFEDEIQKIDPLPEEILELNAF
jgi:hypothetical protein